MRLRVYADRTHYLEPHRSALNDILKALWNDATLDERRATYGKRADLFEDVASPEQADLHLLPMRWQYYVEHECVDAVVRAVELARRVRRPIAMFSLGDPVANLPISGDDIHLFQASGYRSRRQIANHGMPAFIDDPLTSASVRPREKASKPVVGFCGQAGASLARHAFRSVRNNLRLIQWRLGRRRWEPAPFEHTWFRQRVLDIFDQSAEVETRFIIRAGYRAGIAQAANRNDPAERSRREFLENVLDSDYTVCMRGGGNFSVRLFETLALGRIPIFIDTDCLLPYEKCVDWNQYVVWIDGNHLEDAPKLVADHYRRMSADRFHGQQLACRHLWEERLTPDGFYAHFHQHFPEIA